jgi:tetratricopeptide (TPR) repeat protein
MEPAYEPVAPRRPALIYDLSTARSALSGGDVSTAVNHYRGLIRRRADLDEVIKDLNLALQHDHPVDIDIWATLGDAYARKNSLQKALDAYTKAEELLR